MDDIESYVVQAAALQGLTLAPDALQRIALVMGRNAEMARMVMGFTLDEVREPAPVFQATA